MPKETPKKKAKDPTERQKQVLSTMVSKGGSMKNAMIAAGYSPKYAKNPKKFRETASFQELLEDNLPDWLLAETHLELLNAPDLQVKFRALQEAYKIKNKYEPEEIHVVRKYEDLTDDELQKEIERLEKHDKK